MADVIKVFLADPAKGRYGYELMGITGQSSSYLYRYGPRTARKGRLAHRRQGGHRPPRGSAGHPAASTRYLGAPPVSAARVQLAALSERYRPPQPAQPRLVPRGGTL